MSNKITVIIPNYNRNELLRETLNSLALQTINLSKINIYVVDDCSNDDENPLDVINEFNHIDISFLRNETNLGQINNLNRCINISQTEYTHLLHSDDLLLPDFYERVFNIIDNQPEIGFVFSPSFYIDHTGRIIGDTGILESNNGVVNEWLTLIFCEQLIQTPSIVVKTQIYRELGGFRSDLRCAEDWEMWVRISILYNGYYIPERLSKYRVHNLSTSGSVSFNGVFLEDLKKLQLEFFRIHKSKVILQLSRRKYSDFFVANVNRISGISNYLAHFRYISSFWGKLKFIYYRLAS
jgi:glycosyltransferase involved in cell wall biosynthesis